MRNLPINILNNIYRAKNDVANSVRAMFLNLIGTIIVLMIAVFVPEEINKWILKTACIIFIILPVLKSFMVYKNIMELSDLAEDAAENYKREFKEHMDTKGVRMTD